MPRLELLGAGFHEAFIEVSYYTADGEQRVARGQVGFTVTTPELKPADPPAEGEGFSIDYIEEDIVLEPGYEVSLDGVTWYARSGDVKPGSALLVRVAEVPGASLASKGTPNAIPARPEAPRIEAVTESVEGAADGRIIGLSADVAYEYSANYGWDWKDVPAGATEVIGLGQGTYLVRAAATEDAFASELAEATIAKGQAATCILSIAPIVFDDLEEGYAQTPALPVLASNDGNSDVVITGIEISGDQPESFVLDAQSNVKVRGFSGAGGGDIACARPCGGNVPGRRARRLFCVFCQNRRFRNGRHSRRSPCGRSNSSASEGFLAAMLSQGRR